MKTAKKPMTAGERRTVARALTWYLKTNLAGTYFRGLARKAEDARVKKLLRTEFPMSWYGFGKKTNKAYQKVYGEQSKT
jgi:hypothetical protein